MIAQQTLFSIQPLPLTEKNGVEHLPLQCKTILNHVDTVRMPDCFTVNPYRGCEFGCAYCYARYTHEFMELDCDDFEKRIFVKRDADRVLLRTFDAAKIAGRHIAFGTATDPYQPAEARFKLTRRLLEVLTQVSGQRISVTTKSSLVKRDLDLFSRLSRSNELRINISLISLDEKLLRCLEPKSSRPEARMAALRALRSGGIRAGIFLMPVLPGLTDGRSNLEAVIRAARLADASFVSAGVVFLRRPAKATYYRWLERHRPHLYSRYQRLFGNGSTVPEGYRKKVMGLVEEIKREYGF